MAYHSRSRISGEDPMQKYMILSTQQEVIRRRLSLQLPPAAPMTAQSPEFQSISSSPAFSRHSSSSAFSPDPMPDLPQSAYPIPTQPGIAHESSRPHSHTTDCQKLCEINQQIKATLTELLNTESVRSDSRYRAWIQERLMDAEQQIRKQRRRKSSGDREMAASIHEHFEHGNFRFSM